MIARIYRPAKTAMQSGKANTQKWLLEYEPEERKVIDPLMGWTGSGDMRGQVKLAFDTREEAVAYATRNGIAFQIAESRIRPTKPKNYSQNFAFARRGQWTH